MLSCWDGDVRCEAADLAYLCPDCWTELVGTQFTEFRTKWEPRMAEVDWNNLSQAAESGLGRLPDERHVAGWCCGKQTHDGHNPFQCSMRAYLKEDVLAKRKTRIEQGEKVKPLCHEGSPNRAVSAGSCVVL